MNMEIITRVYRERLFSLGKDKIKKDSFLWGLTESVELTSKKNRYPIYLVIDLFLLEAMNHLKMLGEGLEGGPKLTDDRLFDLVVYKYGR